MTPTAPTSTLDGWRRAPFTGAGITHDCYSKGAGRGVILIPEIPGISPEVLGLADHLVSEGFTVVIPSPFGVPGKPTSTGYILRVAGRLCVASEFRAFALGAHRPFSDYLRALARDLTSRTGSGVGIIGMCFTGGFALTAAVDDAVIAPVLSQPSVPFPLGAARRRDTGASEEELARIAARTEEAGLCLLGLRFSQDRAVPAERFAALKERLGDAFDVIELDSSPGNAAGFSANAHAVLTHEVRDVPGHPALLARDRVVAFLKERLS
jgi:dienelactone hydrolase